MRKLLFVLLVAVVGCSAKQEQCKPYYYHIELQDSVMIITEHGRFVASVPYNRTGVLDSIFVDDNE